MARTASQRSVVFYPTTASYDAEHHSWSGVVHGSTFQPQHDSRKRAALIGIIARALRLEKDSAASEILESRLRHFLVDHRRGRRISVRLGQQTLSAGPSQANGHFFGDFQLSDDEACAAMDLVGSVSRCLSYHTEANERRIAGRVHLAPPTGLSVISDIDDTIKITEVAALKSRLANTFLREFQTVPGMAIAYQAAATRGAVFHYVSASPWQLYEPLEEMLSAQGFPAGSFHLKNFRLTDKTLIKFFASPVEMKLGVIRQLLSRFPRRRFLLIGDSGEKDPEIYRQVAEGFPGQVRGIFIRNITGESDTDQRFRETARLVGRGHFGLFSDPDELRMCLMAEAAACTACKLEP